ncbi:hypothetical protein HYT56_03010 [Candidatus Woesearchaeota archaeon]|nr:hypothetical protein [Candidatus Woesearchaeota archaeon]
MNLSDKINLEKVQIIGDEEDFYRVKYGDQEYQIAKSDETSFEINHSPIPSHGLRLEQRIDTLPSMSIFQDESAPEEYRE